MQKCGLIPDVITYNALMSACEKGHQWNCVMNLLACIQRHWLEHNVVTYGTLMCAHANVALWAHALSLLKEVLLASIQLNLILFSASISACEKGFQWVQA